MVDRKQRSAFIADIIKQNKFHISDFYYAVQISICLLKPIGAWPLRQQATKVEIIVHGLSIAVATFLQFFAVASWIACIITTNWSFYEILRTACPLIFTITVFLRYLLLLSHQHEIKSCIDRIAEDWRNVTIAEDRKIMLANAKSGRFFGIISVAFMFGSGLPYTCMPLMLPPIVTEDNVTIRSFPNPCELIFLDVQVSPVYEITYALVALSCFTAYTVFCGICSLTAKFVTHICGQCEILMYIFDELVDGGDRNCGTVDQRISTAIRHHLRILKFVSDIDKVLNEICLAEFINASCNMCLLGYYVIMDWNTQESMLPIFVYFVAFISITFNIYIFCYIGERLVDRCQKVGIKCYMIEWYRLPQNKARNLMFPIIMSNYPVELTAGKMVKLTMSSFSNILKTSMAYLNLLREVSSRDIM
ncbi:odorant receptor 63a-like [Formica exsecta]|uniref:odorant receptor 63a-like n=1 Tax=Formica exsecta TaxID=72781 RepID=UPI001142C4CE|nr:odorant receptor 63a-like [Formica exsecta]